MVSIIENKDHLIKSYNTLKELYKYDFAEEQNILKLFNQLTEFNYSEEKKRKNSKEFQAYRTNFLTKDIRRDRDEATNKITLHRGIL
ncbi:MAG: hypothetical protein ACFFDS_04495 [Candidatus Thorarchaeota archaeon]